MMQNDESQPASAKLSDCLGGMHACLARIHTCTMIHYCCQSLLDYTGLA